jgi:hypothetical protein
MHHPVNPILLLNINLHTLEFNTVAAEAVLSSRLHSWGNELEVHEISI